MIADLAVPYADVSAGDLTFATDAPKIEVLDHLEVNGANGIRLVLRLLGASHQAVINFPSGEWLAETLAYRPELTPHLPEQHIQGHAEWRHQFRCQTKLMDPPEFSEFTSQIHERAWNNPHLLIGVFGADPDAFTALEVTGRDPLAWHTVHTYPQYGQVVLTHSHLKSL